MTLIIINNPGRRNELATSITVWIQILGKNSFTQH